VRRLDWHDERGDSGPLEMVILVPVLLALVALVVASGRTTAAASDVEFAARVGARAAAQANTAGGAQARAEQVVGATLADSGLTCVDQAISVDTGDLRPGGRVSVTVSCTVSLDDVADLQLALGSRTMTATASEVIDRNRGDGQTGTPAAGETS
jgi:Flp pilus assembly protein TadG